LGSGVVVVSDTGLILQKNEKRPSGFCDTFAPPNLTTWTRSNDLPVFIGVFARFFLVIASKYQKKKMSRDTYCVLQVPSRLGINCAVRDTISVSR
jgi:hypothetical protein